MQNAKNSNPNLDSKTSEKRDNGSDQPSSDATVDHPSNLQKDPDEWTTGNESMTDAQRSYLKTLSDEADEPFDDTLTKADASKRIDELQQRTGRGISR